MTRDELRAKGYHMRWQEHTKRRFTVTVFLSGHFVAKLTGRSQNMLRDEGYKRALAHFVMLRLS